MKLSSRCAKRYTITDFVGNPVEVWPTLELYAAYDFAGKKMPSLCIQLNCEDGPYATLTVNLGEFIGVKNCAYIDTNNCYFADQLLKLLPVKDTGLTRSSGFCTYPLWAFEPDFLRSIGPASYDCYSKAFDKYMRRLV